MQKNYLKQLPGQEIKIHYNHQNYPIYVHTERMAADTFEKILDRNLVNIQKEFYVLFLDDKNRALAWLSISSFSKELTNIHLLISISKETPRIRNNYRAQSPIRKNQTK